MKKIAGFTLITSLALIIACSKPEDHGIKTYDFSEQTLTINLHSSETTSFRKDQLTISLDSMADSRCPVNANCIWGGTAITKFTFIKNGRSYPVSLALPPFASYQQEVQVAGYTIKLINVYPYPDLSSNAPPAVVKAKVEIKNY